MSLWMPAASKWTCGLAARARNRVGARVFWINFVQGGDLLAVPPCDGIDPMAVDDTGMEVMLPHECLQLLAAHTPKVGRVGVVVDGRPDVLPVNYAVFDGAVVFRTDRGAKLTAALQRAPMAFEVDAIDESWEEGWSVVVHGHAEVVEADDQSVLDALPLRPWVPAERAHYVRIVADSISGRSIEGRRRRNDVPAWDLHGEPRRD